MKRFMFFPAVIVAVSILFSACSAPTSPRSNEARTRAVAAAKILVAVDHSDTLALQRKILDAKSAQSEYTIIGDSIAARDFGTAFKDYLSAHDKSLYHAIFQ